MRGGIFGFRNVIPAKAGTAWRVRRSDHRSRYLFAKRQKAV
ncbi:hypothetical protein HMPREF9120_02154 [Neisseria sp. oral taxon 020 str. F0370]|nr:hypothetical protein HMPREF9120_02154 [Neisseria sp. oral taxon 020 str. F0370]